MFIQKNKPIKILLLNDKRRKHFNQKVVIPFRLQWTCLVWNLKNGYCLLFDDCFLWFEIISSERKTIRERDKK